MSLIRTTDVKKHMARRVRKQTDDKTEILKEKVAPFPFHQPAEERAPVWTPTSPDADAPLVK